MLLLKNGWRYELQLSQVWIKSNGACFRVIFEILKFTGVGHVTIFRKICQNQSRWIILKLGSLVRAHKTKHFQYKNHGLEMNGSKDIAILAFLLMTSSKFKMATRRYFSLKFCTWSSFMGMYVCAKFQIHIYSGRMFSRGCGTTPPPPFPVKGIKICFLADR